MKIILLTILLFISSLSYSQKGIDDFYLDMSDMSDELSYLNIQSAWDYIEFYDCSDDSGNAIPQQEIDKKLSSVIKKVKSDFIDSYKPYEAIINKNEKRLSRLRKQYPYYPYRYREYDSLLVIANNLLKEIKPKITAFENSLIDHLKQNICNEDAQDIVWEEDTDFSEKFYYYIEDLINWTAEEYYFFDMDRLAKAMKKHKLVDTRWNYEPESFEGNSVLLTGQIEAGTIGLYGQGVKTFEELLPPLYDSIQYNNESSLAFAWKEKRATLYYMYDRHFYDDSINEDTIPSEYSIPYERVEYFKSYDYWDVRYIYFAKKEGRWGMVNALDNSVFLDFTYTDIESIELDKLNFEKLNEPN